MVTSSPLDVAPTSAAFLADILGASVDVIDVSFLEGGDCLSGIKEIAASIPPRADPDLRVGSFDR
jgi:hypothetical protein